MLPARFYSGNSAAGILQTMDQQLCPNSAALILNVANQRGYSEWLGVRLFIAWFQSRLNPHQWQSVARRYAGLLSDLHLADGLGSKFLSNWPPMKNAQAAPSLQASANSPWSVGLPWDEAAWLDALQHPSLLKMLAHTWSVTECVYQNVTELLMELMAMQPLTILIPDLALIDKHSREVLLRLVRCGHGQSGELMLGLLQTCEAPHEAWFQRNGQSLNAQQKEAVFDWLFSLDLNTEHVIRAVDTLPGKNSAKHHLGSRRESRQREAWTQRMVSELEFTLDQDASMRLQSMWHWFQVHAHQQVYNGYERMPLAALAQLSSMQQGLYHALVSLSSYNLGLQSSELHRWLSLVIEHAEHSLNLLPPGPLHTRLQLMLAQLSLHYPEEFLSYDDQLTEGVQTKGRDYCALAAQSAARQLGRLGAYQRVWAALFLARQAHQQLGAHKPLYDPLRELPQHLRLAAPDQRSQSACQRDWALSAAVVRTTLNELGAAQLCGEWPQELQQGAGLTVHEEPLALTGESCTSHVAHELCYEAEYWIHRYRKQLNTNAAQVWAQAAKQFGNSLGNAYYADTGCLQLASCSYQLGALNSANREYVEWRSRQDKWRSQVLRTRGQAQQSCQNTPWLQMVMAAWRVGSVHTAQAVLQHQLQGKGLRDPGENAVYQAMASLLAATRGENKLAKHAFQSAIDHANEAFSLRVFSQITILMGLAYEAIRAHRSASALYRNLLDHAFKLTNARAADMFPVMIRWMRLQQYNRDYVAYSLRNIQNILQEPENWWYLGDLMELMRHNESNANFSMFDQGQMTELVWCASQRLDCEAVTRQFCQRLPVAMREQLLLELSQRHQQLSDELPPRVLGRNPPQSFQRHAKFLQHCQVLTGSVLATQWAR